jgi:undecaprenyl phosphate-alpha-L-ara4FN deformylase
MIGKRLGDLIRRAAREDHEIGLHAWDHYEWQAHADAMPPRTIRRNLALGVDTIRRLTGRPPVTSAAPAWKCSEPVLLEKEGLPFAFNSACRGDSTFFPRAGGRGLRQPQVPVTLPTYDEIIGRNGVTDANYNETLLSGMRRNSLNVLTIHAEVEGICRRDLFEEFLAKAAARKVQILPLGSMLACFPPGQTCSLARRTLPGREGELSVQAHQNPETEGGHRFP